MMLEPRQILPVDVIFHPDWWYTHYGLDFREPFHFDPGTYLLPYECWLAERLQPYGIHHCGDNLEHVIQAYARVPGLAYVDVGWGSDVAACRQVLPEALFSLRLSPVRLRTGTPEQVQADVEHLLDQAGPLDKVALCCVSMDSGTPDENVRAIFKVVERYRQRVP